MKMRNHILRLLTVCILGAAARQAFSFPSMDWDTFVSEYTAEEELHEDEDWILCLEELKLLHENPININTATIEELMQMPFLTESQIEQIHSYIYLHGEMQTLGELRLIPLLDSKTMEWMKLFVVASPQPKDEKNEIFKNLKHELSTRLDIPLYYRKGYMTSKGYVGDPLYSRIKYNVGNSRHFRAGIRTEKDAGERFYDSYGAFVQLKDVGILKNAVIGDYRIGFGEGLVVGGNRWYSKTSPYSRQQSGARPMTSMDETNFLRGATVTLKYGKAVTSSVFASYRQMDATLNSEGEVQTLLSGGYHRTRTEREKKNNLYTAMAGANVTWQYKGFSFGATGYYQHFSLRLNPGKEAYRRYYPKGKDFLVGGLCYGYSKYRFTFAGETAFAHNSVATLNRLTWIASKSYTLTAIQRYYDKAYSSMQAGAFGEQSTAQNENGIMLHLKAEPWERWNILSYVDFFFHQWPRYHINHSTSGHEAMMQVTHALSKQHSITARYQYKRKETTSGVEPHHRLKIGWTTTSASESKLQVWGQLHSILGNKGWALQAQASSPQKWILKSGLMLGYFHTNNYQCRIYMYEPSLLSSVSSAMYYGHGIHGVATCRWISRDRRWMLEGKYSVCRYLDRKEQGSDLQTIFSPWKNDISFQFRMKI